MNKENNVIVKILSGDIFSLKVDDPSCHNSIVKELNKINQVQFPLIRTHLVKDNLEDNLEDNIYYAYINTHLYIELRHRSIAYTNFNGFIITECSLSAKEDFDVEEIDGKTFANWRGFTSLQVKFDMPSSTFYRLFVVSIINYEHGGPIISYKYDADSKEDYEKITRLLKNKEIKLDEEHIKNVMLELFKQYYTEEYYNHCIQNGGIYKLYKDSIHYRDDTIIVLNCNGEMVYTDHYHRYHYEQQPDWTYYIL